ncbi:MAG: hypothetical protein IJ003_05860 [Candidatus Gastranaerophilales bacterium]|nr:hypothetical protein [Candidatus Gastranaerophilales bacterium]
MILITCYIVDNFIVMMRGLVIKLYLVFSFLFTFCNFCLASEKVGIITDTLLTPVHYYNAYFRTPEFFAQDIRGQLLKKNISVVSIDETQNALKKAGIKQNDLQALQGLQQGYNLEYNLLKKIGKNIGANKLIIVTMGMDVQRDFLKNTAWNIMNVPGMDVVNPTHRVSVYVGFVDIKNETMLWESIYAKNIRNNKMKNLDTTISNNYEGMLRLKEYSKYISPDIAYNVKMKMLNPNFVEPATYITRENLKQYAKDRHNIGVKKELSEIERQKWDTEKLKEDTKENIIEFTNNTKDNVVELAKTTKKGIVKASNATQKGFKGFINKIFKRKSKEQWL